MLVILSSLLDRCESRLVTLRKLAVDVGPILRLVLLPLALESLVHLVNLPSIVLLALCFQFGNRPGIRHHRARRMLGVGLPNRQEVIVVQDDATLLHDPK